MIPPSRRAQLQRYRKDSDIVNDLLTALEDKEKLLADIAENAEQLLDRAHWRDNELGVALAQYVIKVINEQQT